MADRNVSVDIQCVMPKTPEEEVILQSILKRMKRMGIAPSDRDHIILAQDREIDCLRDKIRNLEKRPMPAPTGPNVFYLCDRRACDRCLPIKNGCRHTADVRHAKNFQLRGDAFRELERADE